MIPFYLKHLDSFDYFSKNALAIMESTEHITKFTVRYDMFFPDEIPDHKMNYFPLVRKTDYCTKLGYEKEGELPDDLTQTEHILTKVLHGQMNKEYAGLLVSALENMEIANVYSQMREIFR